MSRYQQRVVEKDNKFIVQYKREGMFGEWRDFPAKFDKREDAIKYQRYGILVKLPDDANTVCTLRM